MRELERRYTELKNKLPSHVTLIAVSKTQPYEKIRALYELGQRDFGENYVQELLEKAAFAKQDQLHEIRWHFIGHLQTNKVKSLVPCAYAIHTIDSLKLAHEISRRSMEFRAGSSVNCLIEVNIDHEPGKSGFHLMQLNLALVLEISQLSGIELKGLMCIPNPELNIKASFSTLRESLSLIEDPKRHWLSMGMSADFQLAISEGATHVRVGTVLFGPRK